MIEVFSCRILHRLSGPSSRRRTPNLGKNTRERIRFLTPHQAVPSGSRGEFGIAENETIYFCPHRLPKYQPSFDSLFKEILELTANSRIVLLAKPDTVGETMLRQRLRYSLGDTLFTRIAFLPPQNVPELRRLFAAADVVLDSPVYSGSLTSYDAFAQGIPVVTLPGELAVQCYTSGLYRRMDLNGFSIPQTIREYVDQAVTLGSDPDYRRHVRHEIERKRELIFEDSRCVDDFERFFETVAETSEPAIVSRFAVHTAAAGRLDDLAAFIREQAGTAPVKFFLNPGNAGDALINVGMFHLLERHGIRHEIIPHGAPAEGQVLFYSGGGNFVPYYNTCKEWLRRYHETNRCIVMPHTIDDEFVKQLSPQTTLICRELVSYDFCKRLSRCEVFHHHDLAFFLDLERLGIVPQTGSGTLHAFRQDVESTRANSNTTLDLSMNYHFSINDPESIIRCATQFLDEINRYGEVHTDRLHVAIGAAILGKKCKLFPSGALPQPN